MSHKNKRLFYLDFLRAISIFMIIIYHFNQQLGFHAINSSGVFIQNFKNDNIGSLGITLFIILSGASLMYSYKENFSLKKFLVKRFLSIFPLFWIGYIVTFFVLFVINKGLHHNVEPWKMIFTLIGFDGFLYYKIPNFYLVGEWFLGFIIIMYLIFPVLRYLVLKYPVLTTIVTLVIYILTVENYNTLFRIDVVHNPLTRLPEMLLGMMYIQYSEKLKRLWYLIPAIIVSLLLFIVKVDIPHIYVTFILGSSLFIVLAYLTQFIKMNQLKESFSFISKYSFAAFIIHHNLIGQFLVRFDTLSLSQIETYALFTIVSILIFWLSMYLYRASSKLSQRLKLA
ncbi:Peptidoglycan/LPS O-acetylase OafA/YrhL, contains acyltransferase and SGNH-hydrolase domains [Paenibacillus sp. cl141a]|uniref:acyltransferase family protein n=1 Tax=Paenibacillus sp. cl141a TaxID=1761877 RepID=UPI0008D1EA5C|nr:Peptidoglycan/LPS O-acetylase OafA/YrhL, contains acyltransferase and SGNH-hydrolase domains [Paenibacillus sp. cl141a]